MRERVGDEAMRLTRTEVFDFISTQTPWLCRQDIGSACSTSG
jgi:hypothetical protein